MWQVCNSALRSASKLDRRPGASHRQGWGHTRMERSHAWDQGCGAPTLWRVCCVWMCFWFCKATDVIAMCRKTHVYTHSRAHAHAHLRAYAYIHTDVHAHTHAHTHTLAHTHIHTYMHLYTYIHVPLHMHMHLHIHRTRTHAHRYLMDR